VTRLLFRLRPEEAVALAFLLPTTWLTVAANLYAREAGVLGARHPGGMLRLGLAIALAFGLALALRFRPDADATRALRDVLPFLLCVLVYTNLHDTIGFVNPHDVHHHLVALDKALFGVEPTLWAERFITPARTEWMQFFYANFFWLAPSSSLILLMRGRWPEFRATTLAIMTCFYMGYALYVLFPAAPPRLVLAPEYTVNLYGYPQFFSKLNADLVLVNPERPSLLFRHTFNRQRIDQSLGVAGVASAVWPNSIFDALARLGSLFGLSMPIFWTGLVLIVIFSLWLNWLPVGGAGSLTHLILPAVTLALPSVAMIARLTRSAVLDVLREDYVRTARAKGVGEVWVLGRHALRNALIPIITLVGLQSGQLMGGAVLTETVFAWPGLGRLMVKAIFARDYVLLQGAVLVFALAFVIINLLVDLSYGLLDPRVGRQG
jgi:hypothetical protein